MNQNASRCADRIKRVLSEKRVSGLGVESKVSPAASEVHCTYRLYEGQTVAISVAPDSEAERHYLPHTSTHSRSLREE